MCVWLYVTVCLITCDYVSDYDCITVSAGKSPRGDRAFDDLADVRNILVEDMSWSLVNN